MKVKRSAAFLCLILGMVFVTGMPSSYAMSVSGRVFGVDSNLGFTMPVAGTWVKENGSWYYRTGEGVLKNRWACIETDGEREWYCFDASGKMRTGWVGSKSGNWYYLREISDARAGAMEKGWLYEPVNGCYFYLDPEKGAVKTGWCMIEGAYYFFQENGKVPFVWDQASGKFRVVKTGGKPLGALYTDCVTPDGYIVDADGKWLGGKQ